MASQQNITPRFLRGAGGGKKKSKAPKAHIPTEAPNTLQSKNTVRIVDLICEGPVRGLVDGAKSIYLDDTPLENADGSRNFDGIYYELREGTPDQDPLTGFPGVEAEVSVGAEVKFDTAIVRTITEPDTDAVRIKIQIPQLTQQQSTGDLTGATVEFKIEIQADGGSYELAVLKNETNPIVISGKTTSAYESAYRVELPPDGAPWNVRVSRITPDSDAATLQNKTIWSTYTRITDVKLRYPDSVLVGTEVDTQYFGTDSPTRAFEMYGLETIKIPANYDPETREYDGIWDGTFIAAYTNNPAWILYDLLTQKRYGLGDTITEGHIDKWSLYDIGKYCDEMVPDGRGGTEPRFTFNYYFNAQREAYDVINSIVSAFRGMAYWHSGAVVPVQDSPKDPVKLLTPANVINGDFNYSTTALKARHTVVFVSWNDPENQYKQSIAVVQDQELIRRYGWRKMDTSAFGCTSLGQATRFGKWILDTERYETETVTYKASLDHMDIRPGDVILIADPSIAGVDMGGRIASATTLEVELDRPFTLNSGATYELSAVLPDGTVETKAVINLPGETTFITVGEAFTEAPLTGAMWVISSSEVAPRPFRILAIREEKKNLYEVTALLYDGTKYDRVERDLKVEADNYSLFPTGAVAPPSNLTFGEYLYKAGPAIKFAITISWTPSPDPRVGIYQVDYKAPNDVAFRQFDGETAGNSVNLENATDGVYEFRVRAIDAFGGTRSPYISATYEARGLKAPPADVQNFRVAMMNGNAYLSWSPVQDLDLSHYVVKYSPALIDASWATSVVIMDRISRDATGVSVQARVGTYLIKAVDLSESPVESENAALIVSTISGFDGYNVIEVITESPTFAGDKSGCTVVDGELSLSGADTVDDWEDVDAVINFDIGNAGIVSSGEYHFALPFDQGDVFTSRITPAIEAYGTDLFSNVDLWEDFDAVENVDGGNPTKWSVDFYIAITNDAPLVLDGMEWVRNPDAEWSAFMLCTVGDYTARGFDFIAVLKSLQDGISPVVTRLGVAIDMPDRVHSDDDVVCPVEGLTVVFDPAFKAKPGVAFGHQDMQTGDRAAITDLSAEGFTIQYFDDGDAPVERTFDYVAKGYGFVTEGLPIIPVEPAEGSSLDFSDEDNSAFITLI